MNASSSSATSRERGCAAQLSQRDAVHGERALVDVALGIQVAVELAGRSAGD